MNPTCNLMGDVFKLIYKKREAEYQATIAAMQKRIEEIEGMQKQMFPSLFVNFVYTNRGRVNYRDGRSAKHIYQSYISDISVDISTKSTYSTHDPRKQTKKRV